MNNRNLPLKIVAVCLFLLNGLTEAQDFKTLIKSHLQTKNSIKKTELNDLNIISEDFSTSMNGNVIKFQQTYQNIPIYNATGTAFFRDKNVAYLHENFTNNYVSSSKPSEAKSSKSIFAQLAGKLNIKNVSAYSLINYEDSDLDTPFVKTRQIYFKTSDNNLRLCYELVYEEIGTSNYWDVFVDAVTGEIYSKENLTVFCSFSYDAFGHDYSNHLPEQSREHNLNENTTGTSSLAPLNASYRVFPLPVESPNHGSRQLLSNPWIIESSPEGWHSIPGGTYVGNYIDTRGNNVMAYEDSSNTNGPGLYANGGSGRSFDFPFIPNETSGNQKAAITNLFYVNNRVHDIFYKIGFTETARNFQAWNFGKGGMQNDYVQAEAQDGSGRNNANFATPADGTRPRMQMYLYDPVVVKRVFYNSPPEAIGRSVINFVSTTFGPQLTETGVTADVAISPVADACTPLPGGSLAGKIGLVVRGSCDFQAKVQAVQDAGGMAAIIYNAPNSTSIGGMGGTNPNILIPSVLIENSEGDYIKNLISAGKNVNITLKYNAAEQEIRDASFDNGIIIHEYGHGISTRLVGQLSSTLNKEQMGEGWSDFFALMLTNRPGDNASVARGIGTYASSESINGNGIRPAKYSPDINVNNFTYQNTNGMEYANSEGNVVPDVHSIGFIWASILWDLHWVYAEKYGYASDVVANPKSGSARLLQLVVDALKLTPANPGFIEGRDAILRADEFTTGKKDHCRIWQVFAARGLGLYASAGSRTDINDQLASFSMPAADPACSNLSTTDVDSSNILSLYPNPAKNEFFIQNGNKLSGKVDVEIYDVTGKLLSSQKVSGTEKISTQQLTNGMYIIKVSGVGVNYSTKLLIKK